MAVKEAPMKVIKSMFGKFTAREFYMKKQELVFGDRVLGLAHLTFSIFIFFTMVLLPCLVLPTGVLAQERLAVTSNIANVRSGPGTNYDILWRVEKYYPLIVLEKKEGWVHFKDFEGDKAWIHNSLVKKINAVITLKDNCNVRSGPGTNTSIVFTVEKGVPFKILETRGEWVNVEHADGDKGWVFKGLLW